MRRLLLALWCMHAGPLPLAAQADSSVESFLERARAGSERYRDPAQALADGYHAIGVEAPAMGQHWIQPARLIAGRFDPDRPPILEYATIRGAPVLVGIAYAVVLAPGESPPDFPGGKGVWHSHGRDIEDESLRLSHEDGPSASAEERIAVLHAWIWAVNPAGTFTPLNWTLPYLRAGIPPPPLVGLDARALSLTDQGAAFWEAALARAIHADPAEAGALHRALTAYGDSVAGWSEQRVPGSPLTDRDLAWLGALWGRLRGVLEAGVQAQQRERISMLTGP